MAGPDHVDVFSFPPQPGDLEPFTLGSGELGVLLIHGFCGTPPEMRGLGEHLANHGFHARGMLLPGHGTTPEDLDRFGWRDWVDAAQSELDTLGRQSRHVFVAGQSMGGTISLLLAARNPEVTAVATTSALVNLGWRTHAMIRAGRYVRKWHYPDRGSVDLWDADAVRLLRSYNRRSLRAHNELLSLMAATWRELPRITRPALVMHGRRDGVVPPVNASLIADRIGPAATLRYFERSGHAMTVDVDKDEVFRLVTDHFNSAVANEAAGAASLRQAPV